MNTITIKRRELVDYDDTFHQAGCCLCSPTDDREQYLKFKYACGRNWRCVQALLKKAQAEVNRMIAPTKPYWQFLKAREALASDFSKKDAKGQPILIEKDGQDVYSIDTDRIPEANARLAELQLQYASDIEQHARQDAEAAAYLDSDIPLDLFTVPWGFVPDQVNGSYLERLTCMLTGVPDAAGENNA